MAVTDDSRIGAQIADRYRLDRVIGKGGMGVVYQGQHLWTGRRIAVKLLVAEANDDQNAAKRFLREARAAAAVRHPNLVEVLDVGQAEDGLMYLVLELLVGESLLDHLARRVSMRPEDVLDVLVPILDALAALHESKVVHRDVKPGNIFLSTDGSGRVVPKLLDLGISKPLDADDDLTVTGALMGTPHYMSPEQARGIPDIGFSADLWAIGVVLYQCLSGARPFEADTVPGLLFKISTERPESIAKSCPDLPKGLVTIVDRALAYDAENRQASATELADALVNAAMSSGWPLTCRIPAGPRISLSLPDAPHDTVDPDATPISENSGRKRPVSKDNVAKPKDTTDPDATPISTDPVSRPEVSEPMDRDESEPPIDEFNDTTPASHSLKARPDKNASNPPKLKQVRPKSTAADKKEPEPISFGPSSTTINVPMQPWKPVAAVALVFFLIGGGYVLVSSAFSGPSTTDAVDRHRAAALDAGARTAQEPAIAAPTVPDPTPQPPVGQTVEPPVEPPVEVVAEPAPTPPEPPTARPHRPRRPPPPPETQDLPPTAAPERGANNALIIE